MIMEIGITAGEIWHYLEKKGTVSIQALYRDIPREREIILMSIGWLAREGHVVLEKDKTFLDYKVWLRKE